MIVKYCVMINYFSEYYIFYYCSCLSAFCGKRGLLRVSMMLQVSTVTALLPFGRFIATATAIDISVAFRLCLITLCRPNMPCHVSCYAMLCSAVLCHTHSTVLSACNHRLCFIGLHTLAL